MWWCGGVRKGAELLGQVPRDRAGESANHVQVRPAGAGAGGPRSLLCLRGRGGARDRRGQCGQARTLAPSPCRPPDVCLLAAAGYGHMQRSKAPPEGSTSEKKPLSRLPGLAARATPLPALREGACRRPAAPHWQQGGLHVCSANMAAGAGGEAGKGCYQMCAAGGKDAHVRAARARESLPRLLSPAKLSMECEPVSAPVAQNNLLLTAQSCDSRRASCTLHLLGQARSPSCPGALPPSKLSQLPQKPPFGVGSARWTSRRRSCRSCTRGWTQSPSPGPSATSRATSPTACCWRRWGAPG